MKNSQPKRPLEGERWKALSHLEKTLDVPMTLLAFLWLILTVIDLVQGLAPFLENVVYLIWIIFWLNFILEFILAPKKKIYLTKNWLTLLALIIPGLRVFRIVRFLRYARFLKGTYIVRILSSINRGMGALRLSLGRRGLSYVIALTLMVIFSGAAGIMVLENDDSQYFENYGTAVWWTSMMITTMGSDYFPKSSEGRFLALLLAIYGFAVFGYVTATVASFFVDHDATMKPDKELDAIKKELRELKELIKSRNP